MTGTGGGPRRRATFFLALTTALILLSLAVEILWRGHVRDAIDLGPLTPPRMQGDIALELQQLGIGMAAIAVGRVLLVLPTAVFWSLWLVRARRTLAVVGTWCACTAATLALWAYSYRQLRTLSWRSGTPMSREATLDTLAAAADIVLKTDVAFLAVALAALVLVRAAAMPPCPAGLPEVGETVRGGDRKPGE